MTINPIYAELLGKELQRDRLREAEKERLINQVIGRNHAGHHWKVFSALSSQGRAFWNRIIRKKGYIPISREPKKSPIM
jgi:hypothetical protein